MKEYKLSYAISSLLSLLLFYIVVFIPLFPFFCIIGYIDKEYLMTFKLLFILIIIMILFSFVFMVIHLICKIFVKKKVIITNDSLIYKNTTIEFRRINKINFVCPSIGRSSFKPHSVNIFYKKDYIKEDICVTIDRMPLVCIYKICKKCDKTVFHINGFKKIYIILPLCIILGCIILDLALYFIQ